LRIGRPVVTGFIGGMPSTGFSAAEGGHRLSARLEDTKRYIIHRLDGVSWLSICFVRGAVFEMRDAGVDPEARNTRKAMWSRVHSLLNNKSDGLHEYAVQRGLNSSGESGDAGGKAEVDC
jgi:hypothetical protein